MCSVFCANCSAACMLGRCCSWRSSNGALKLEPHGVLVHTGLALTLGCCTVLLHLCVTPCREAIDKITEELLEKETLTGDEMREILAQYTTIPEENLKAAREQEEAKEAVVA